MIYKVELSDMVDQDVVTERNDWVDAQYSDKETHFYWDGPRNPEHKTEFLKAFEDSDKSIRWVMQTQFERCQDNVMYYFKDEDVAFGFKRTFDEDFNKQEKLIEQRLRSHSGCCINKYFGNEYAAKYFGELIGSILSESIIMSPVIDEDKDWVTTTYIKSLKDYHIFKSVVPDNDIAHTGGWRDEDVIELYQTVLNCCNESDRVEFILRGIKS